MTPRDAEKRAFLARAGWGSARLAFLAGDASDRSYDRLTLGTRTAVLMDAPVGKGDDPAQFLTIARHLQAHGLSAPAILAIDLGQGFLLLEDLGDALFARELAQDSMRETLLYEAATDVLVHLQVQALPAGLQDLTAADWADAAILVLDWYRFAVTGTHTEAGPLRTALTAALRRVADGPRVMILRDYHAENLLWLPDREGLARVGLLDFQLAQGGQPGYDLVSLLQDARRDVLPETEERMITRFAHAKGQAVDRFRAGYAVLGAQRALRILGIFARLCLVAGKPGYVRMIPRVWGHLQRNLAEPGLERVAEACEALPHPTPEVLTMIEGQCGAFR